MRAQGLGTSPPCEAPKALVLSLDERARQPGRHGALKVRGPTDARHLAALGHLEDRARQAPLRHAQRYAAQLQRLQLASRQGRQRRVAEPIALGRARPETLQHKRRRQPQLTAQIHRTIVVVIRSDARDDAPRAQILQATNAPRHQTSSTTLLHAYSSDTKKLRPSSWCCETRVPSTREEKRGGKKKQKTQ